MNQLLQRDPHATFRFVVSIRGMTVGVFTDCTLPNIEWEVQEVKEGGLNNYIHQLPGRRKAAKITLKKGLIRDAILDWYSDVMGQRFRRMRKTVDITLYSALHRPIIKWSCAKAYPTKWTGPDLKTAENTVATHTLELACAEVTFEKQ